MAKKTSPKLSKKDQRRIYVIADVIVNSVLNNYTDTVSIKTAEKVANVIMKASKDIYNSLPVKVRASYDVPTDEDIKKHIEENVMNLSEASDVRRIKVPRSNVKESGFTDTDKNSCA